MIKNISDLVKKIDLQNPNFDSLLEEMKKELDYFNSLTPLKNLGWRREENLMGRVNTAKTEIEIIQDNIENESIYDNESLRIIACATDFLNSLAHAYKIRYDATKQETEKNKYRTFMAEKDDCIQVLAKISRDNDIETGIFMGIETDEFGKSTVICDIPGVGQLGWHAPGYDMVRILRKDYGIRDYAYSYERTEDIQYNIDVLYPENYKKFGPHNKIVLESFNLNDMHQKIRKYHSRSINEQDR